MTPALFLTPRGAFLGALGLGRWSASLLGELAPGRDARLAWRELAGKLDAFTLYEEGATVAQGSTLAARVAAAFALGPSRAAWVIEGLGRRHAEAELARSGGAVPGDLLAPARTGGALPASSLLALHAGIGLALATEALRRASGIDDGVERFVALCRAGSRPGYAEAALEGLGLIVRTLYPHRALAVDARLAALDPELPGYFWHGVGRGLYFTPTHALPCTSLPWRVVAAARREPPHPEGRANALAGLVWALTLVNLRRPEVLAALLVHHPGLRAHPAVADGVAAATALWSDLAPDDPALAALVRHRPAGPPEIARAWDRQVAGPAAEGVVSLRPRLAAAGRLGTLFHYGPKGGPPWSAP